jgi:hypothetical protein
VIHQIGARLNLKGNNITTGFDGSCKSFHPVAIQSKHVIAKPDVLDTEVRLEIMNLCRNVLRRP